MDDRETQIRDFLARTGWSAARRSHLAGDASDRRYERLHRGVATAVLMDSPPGSADDPAAFIAMSRHLRSLGLSAPEVLAAEPDLGLILLEDLGDALFARLMAQDPSRETQMCRIAVDVLVRVQSAPAPKGLADLTAGAWAEAAALALQWYSPVATGSRPDAAAFTAALTAALQAHADGPRVLILRDYHAENLLWLPERRGLRRAGLLDFQLGQMGQPGYDLVSVLQDARRDVSPAVEAAMLARFATATGIDPDRLAAQCAVLGAQRALRIVGVFSRLSMAGGKPGYLRYLPRVWLQLQRNLDHPALAGLRSLCASAIPAPSPDILTGLSRPCPPSPSPSP